MLNLSTATISDALRDSPRVKASTRERVRRAAEEAGYKSNPLLGAALSAVRRARHHEYCGTLALVDTIVDGKAEPMLFHRHIMDGARMRAEQLGFNTELFWIGDRAPGVSIARLSSMLFARGIDGVVILPLNPAQDFSSFDFSRHSVVQMDHCLVRPQLHMVLPDHYVSMVHALERLIRRGYERIGVCLERKKDTQLLNKWSAAFLSHYTGYERRSGVPALIAPELSEEGFRAWYLKYKPDVVLAHVQDTTKWMRAVRGRRPADFFILNYTERTAPCAGLDLQPVQLGVAAVETVVGMIHRNEKGVPSVPHTITIEASWVEGNSIRPEPTAGANCQGALVSRC